MNFGKVPQLRVQGGREGKLRRGAGEAGGEERESVAGQGHGGGEAPSWWMGFADWEGPGHGQLCLGTWEAAYGEHEGLQGHPGGVTGPWGWGSVGWSKLETWIKELRPWEGAGREVSSLRVFIYLYHLGKILAFPGF